MCIVDHLHVATSSVALREGLSSAVLGAEDFVDDWNQPQPGDADYSDQASERDSDEDTDPIMYKVSKERVLSAARMLFEDRRIKSESIDEYTKFYGTGSVYSDEGPPRAIASILEEWTEEDGIRNENSYWPNLYLVARQLATLILAVAHITDLEASAGLPLCESLDLLAQSHLLMYVSSWNGQSLIGIQEDVWFEIIALLMVGHSGKGVDLQTTSLLSDRGWSVYVNTFGDADAAFLGNTLISPLLRDIVTNFKFRSWFHHCQAGCSLA
ncbi:hypothetical protein B0J14DRAFT_70826 [Halenospora varia]|nr:hypothetical protein B0J14DRAFT_70826 [Halenospora varia]